MGHVSIFAGTGSHNIGQKIAEAYGSELGGLTISRFSDGEISPSFTESVRGCNVFVVQSTNPPAENLMEMLLIIDAARRASAKYVTAIMPYFGYARQDRKDRPRVSIASKLVANLITSAGADRIMTMDLHAGQIQGFFDIPLDHLHASYVFMPYLQSINNGNMVMASPDVGGVARARYYAKHLEVDMVVCDKHRKRANEIASMQVIGDVEGKDVVLIDDMVDTAGTLCRAAALLKEKGAVSVRALCTHPVLSGKAYENIQNSVLEELVVTDSIPLKQNSDRVKVLSIASLFAESIRSVVDDRSISSLFI